MKHLQRISPLSHASIKKVITEIDTYNRAWKVQKHLSTDQLRELRHLATVQSVGSSTRIEGSRLSDTEITNLIDHMSIQKLSSRDEQEVAGYYTVLEIIQEQYTDLELNESLILALHKEMLRYSEKDAHHRGNYKKLPNTVVASDEDGQTRTIFNTTAPALTASMMEAALDWLRKEREAPTVHPLEAIGTFVYEFLSIHPFQDGNGRLSRLITTLLLLQAGYEFVLYASLERAIEEDKAGYYKALMSGQRNRGEEEEEIGRWLYFLLNAIRSITHRLSADEQAIVSEPAVLYLNARQRQILDFVRREGVLSIREIDALLPEISRNTVKYDLRRLTEAGLLAQKGKGRGTVYDYPLS